MSEVQIQRKVVRSRLWLLIIVGVALLIFMAEPYVFEPHDRIPWRTDFNAAVKEAQASHKPLFVDFNASWCGPCQFMKTTTWADRSVERAMRDYVPVSIDADTHEELSERYFISGLPTIVIVDPSTQDGIRGHVGYLDADQFLQWLTHKPDVVQGTGVGDASTGVAATQPSTRSDKP